jgi:hypothetical protein
MAIEANRSQANGEHTKAAAIRHGIDMELDLKNDLDRLQGHGFRKPRR